LLFLTSFEIFYLIFTLAGTASAVPILKVTQGDGFAAIKKLGALVTSMLPPAPHHIVGNAGIKLVVTR